MKLRTPLLVLGLVLAPTAVVFPAFGQPVSQVDSAHKAAADRLAIVVAPDSDVPMMVESVLTSLIAGLVKAEPEMAEFDAEFPGLFDALKVAWRPVLLKVAYQSRPLYRADLSRLYQANLTTAELNEAADFLSQPDVQGFFKAAKSKIEYSSTMADAMAERDVSSGSVRSDLARASAAAVADMPPELKKKLAAFFGSPLGQKLMALNAKKTAIDTKWVNYSPPGAEDEMGQVTLDAMLAHIAKTDPKLAAQMRKQLEADGDLKKKR